MAHGAHLLNCGYGWAYCCHSLSQFTRWLAEQAEEAGVDIFPGMPVSEVLYGDSGEVVGVATA